MPPAIQFKYVVHVSLVLTNGLPTPTQTNGVAVPTPVPVVELPAPDGIVELQTVAYAMTEYEKTLSYNPGTYQADAIADFCAHIGVAGYKTIKSAMNYGSRPVDKTWTESIGEIWLCPVDDKSQVCVAKDAKGVYWQIGFEIDCMQAALV